MTQRPPLRLHILFHPRSESARNFAVELLQEWMAEPVSPGLRVAATLHPNDGEEGLTAFDEDYPDSLDLERAEHTLVVALIDKRMARVVDSGSGDAWGGYLAALSERCGENKNHSLLPIALSDGVFDIHPTLSESNFLKPSTDRAARLAEVQFHVATRALILLSGGMVPSDVAAVRAPIQLFLCHVKVDLKAASDGPMASLLRELNELPVQAWLDSQNIQVGERFLPDIERGIAASDLLILIQTDTWSESDWCPRELNVAKEIGKPILHVNALELGETRKYPYEGNVRSVRWRREQPSRVEALRIASAAIEDAVQRRYMAKSLRLDSLDGDLVLDSPPEAATLAFHPEAKSFLYPDPPLNPWEYRFLSALRPDASFETPLLRAARRLPTESRSDIEIAVSIADSEVLAQHGVTEQHLRTVSDEVHLYLLIAGLRILYGGKLDPDKLDDPNNFTLRLFSLIGRFGGLARNAGVELQPIVNLAPWPLHRLYGDDVLDVFGRRAELERCAAPDLGFELSELEPREDGFVPPDMALRRYAWGVALTEMRETSTERAFARVVMGGKIEGAIGRCPGLVEEPLVSLRRRHPLFLVGSLGGCTRLIIDLLEQRSRDEMTEEVARENTPFYDEIASLYRAHGHEFQTREELAAEIASLGASGPAEALCNGLDDDENRELFQCIEPRRIVGLILTGLERLLPRD